MSSKTQLRNVAKMLKHIRSIDTHELGSAEDRAQRDMLRACRDLIAATHDRHQSEYERSAADTHPITRDDEPLCRFGPGGQYVDDYTPPRGEVGVGFVGRLAAWLLLAGVGVLIAAALIAMI